MSKYRKLKDYEGFVIDPEKETIRFACCDCGLVHDVALAHESEGRIGMALRRHNRATAQLRRHDYGYLQQGKIANYRLVTAVRKVLRDKGKSKRVLAAAGKALTHRRTR